jgi:hypothetical protein
MQRHSIMSNLFLFLIFLVLGVIFAELIMRFYYYTYFPKAGRLPKGLFVQDDFIGYRMADNFETTLSGKSEYNTSIKIRNGWRDDLPQILNFIALGDSVSFGVGVEEKDRYTEVLENRLNITIFNAGVPGYGTYEYLLVLKNLSTRIAENSTIILVAGLLNDISDNSKHSMAWAVYDGVLHEVPYNPFNLPKKTHLYLSRHTKLYPFFSNFIYVMFMSKEKEWASNKETLDAIYNLVVEKKGKLIILLIYNNRNYVKAKDTDITEVKELYLDYCKENNNVICVDPYDVFYNDPSLYYERDVHWTKKGHEAAALTLLPILKTRLKEIGKRD